MTGFSFRLFTASIATAFLALISTAAMAVEGHAFPGQMGLSQSVTPIMDSMVAFHDNVLLVIITGIVIFVLALLIVVVLRFNHKANPVPQKFTHNTAIEIVWTLVPILILIVIAVPSFGVLADQETLPDGTRKYLGSEIFSGGDVVVPAAEITIKAIGAQWYWDYEYMDDDVSITSIMLNDEQLLAEKPNEPRLLAVDQELVVPVDTTVRVLVTAADVLHAFAVPSFGIKVDAVPGRNNETWFNVRKTGMYYGQCSELCGKDHAFMPIAIRVVEKDQYAAWLARAKEGDFAGANLLLAEAK